MRKMCVSSALAVAAAFTLMCLGVMGACATINNSNDYMLPYDVDANTVSLYHFDNDSIDAVGNHDATLNGNAGYSAGRFGNGLTLDSDGDYARMGNIHESPTALTSVGSVELWFTLDSAPTYFVLTGTGTEYGSNWDDGWYMGRHASYSNNFVFMMWAGDWVIADSQVTPESLVGSWHHAMGTWGSRGLELWLDGKLIGTNPYTGGLPNPTYNTMLVGTDSWTWSTPGIIDEVRVSDIQRASAVPEPSSLLALGFPVLMLGLNKLRRLQK